MGNPWFEHVNNVRASNNSKSFKEILIMAKKTYKKVKRKKRGKTLKRRGKTLKRRGKTLKKRRRKRSRR
jgi:hypothetical protein